MAIDNIPNKVTGYSLLSLDAAPFQVHHFATQPLGDPQDSSFSMSENSGGLNQLIAGSAEIPMPKNFSSANRFRQV